MIGRGKRGKAKEWHSIGAEEDDPEIQEICHSEEEANEAAKACGFGKNSFKNKIMKYQA